VLTELPTMSQARAPVSGLVHVTIASTSRRVDLVLPAAVPVAELVPELARSVGLLDAVTAYGGYRLVTQGGRILASDAGLAVQGVEDGTVIAVAAAAGDEPPRVYDDVVEAMADVVERDLRAWDARAARRTALWAAVLLLLVGAGSLVLRHRSERGSALTGAAAVIVAVVLVLAAVAFGRLRDETEAAVVVAVTGCVHAAVAGLLLVRGTPFFADSAAAAGGGALVAGVLAALGLGRGRILLLPPVAVGAVFAATGLATRASSFDPAVVLTTTLVLAVLTGGAFPWLALGATGTWVDQPVVAVDPAGDTADRGPVDASRLAADAQMAHELMVATSATVGVLLVLVAPFAVSLGLAGTLVAVLACAVAMLRSRHHHSGTQVLVGLGGGVLGLASTAVSVLWLHASWRPTAAVVLAVTGTALLVVMLFPRPGSLRRGRLGDLAESLALLAMMPGLVVATGLFSWVRG
jgi:type VII secretion integral membrane protein EccD